VRRNTPCVEACSGVMEDSVLALSAWQMNVRWLSGAPARVSPFTPRSIRPLQLPAERPVQDGREAATDHQDRRARVDGVHPVATQRPPRTGADGIDVRSGPSVLARLVLDLLRRPLRVRRVASQAPSLLVASQAVRTIGQFGVAAPIEVRDAQEGV